MTEKKSKYYYNSDRNTPYSHNNWVEVSEAITNYSNKTWNDEVVDTAKERKGMPVYSGVLNYFPDAIREVARCSQAGNDQHHPNTPLHWDRNKSTDELDALTRHLIEAGTIDSDNIRHSVKVAWRALANLQKELELNGEAPLSKYNK